MFQQKCAVLWFLSADCFQKLFVAKYGVKNNNEIFIGVLLQAVREYKKYIAKVL